MRLADQLIEATKRPHKYNIANQPSICNILSSVFFHVEASRMWPEIWKSTLLTCRKRLYFSHS